MGLIALLTDFGDRDGYVGVMKGVIAGLSPGARVVDVSHAVDPQDVRGASFVLETSAPYFPEGTVFVVVVDPGVGTSRRILYSEVGGRRFVAPDNGVLTRVWRAGGGPARVISVEDARWFRGGEVSRTFHGRDIFAPVAARLVEGLDPGELGPEVGAWGELECAEARAVGGGEWVGEVVYVDRFGTLITNVALGEGVERVEVGGVEVGGGVRVGYGAVGWGEWLLIVGSSGYLEVAVNGGSARERAGVGVGAPVRVWCG